ncbi:MAG: ABC transporter ATP-binding protein [Alkalilacustris sp.]
MTDALLSVRGLRTVFDTEDGTVTAVDGVDLEVRRGEVLAIVGESGCGKSVTALSLMRLIDDPGRIAGGQITYGGQDVLTLGDAAMTRLRGVGMAMIFQQPRGSLNPVHRIGDQIAEQFIRRRGMTRAAAHAEAVAMLGRVGIPGAEARMRAYPHELSGGQAQRVMIAIALALQPGLLIADEPTTALDVTVQAQILGLLTERCRTAGTALILVTHDLGVVAQVADRVAVMYAGRVVEEAAVARLFAAPAHPYTRGLLAAMPRGGHHSAGALAEIPGTVPTLGAHPMGCGFADRCAARRDTGLTRCYHEDPPAVSVAPGHRARCFLLDGQAA